MSISAHDVPSRLSLRANFSWTFVGNIVYSGCQWGMLVALAKLGSPEMVGQFALGLAITAPVILFAGLKLRLVQATDAKQEYLFGHYCALRLATTFLALLVITGIVLASGYRRETALVILALGLAKATESLSDLFYGALQQRDRMDRIAKSLLIKGPLSLIALSLGVYLTGSVFWGTMGMGAAWALVLVAYDMPNARWILRSMPQSRDIPSKEGTPEPVLRPRWDIKALIRLAWLALPLGFVMMLSSLHSNIPRYFVERDLGEAELGVFAALAYFHRSGILVVGALGQSASARLSRHFASGNSAAFRALLLRLGGIGALMGAAGVLVAFVAGREVLTLLYRPEYARQDLFVQLMVASGMAYVASALTYGMTAARRFGVQMLLYSVVTAVLVLASLWLVPSGGLNGAATALIVARLVQMGGSLAVTVAILRTLYGQTERA